MRTVESAGQAALGSGSRWGSAAFGVTALLLGLGFSGAAEAQCTSTIPQVNASLGGVNFSLSSQSFLPLAQGSSVNSLVSVLNSVNTAYLTQTTAFVSAPGGPQPDQQGGGAWARGIGGTVDTDNTGRSTVNTANLGFNTPGSTTCNTTTRADFHGYQVGHDISILNGGGTGANLHFGVTAGYFEADAKDITRGGTFNGTFEVPFAGVYIAFTKGGFFADGQVRADFFQNEVSDVNNGLFGQRFNGQGVSVTGNVGYNQPLGGGWFIEPSIGGVLSRVSLDPLNVSGTLVLADNPTGLALPGTVQINDIESALGRATLRLGTNFTTGQIAWQPFVTASVFHEFSGDVTTTMTANGALFGLPNFSANLSTDRVGTYGQYAIGTAAAIINTGWLGYARFDYRSGENIEGWSVNAGLRYQFTPETTQGMKDGPSPVRDYNWAGLYAGGFAGMLRGDQSWFTAGLGTRDDPENAGYLAGGQLGYNVQVGKLVFGIEGDYGWADAKGGKSCTGGLTPFFFTCEAEQDSLTTLTGRLGYAWGRALFYAKAGLAAGEVTVQTSTNTQLHPLIFTGQPLLVPPVNGETKWQLGWTLGAGMEFAISDRWSAKAEYLYYDLGGDDYRIDSGLVASAETQGSSVRIGINYHFNPPPAPLK
jgi:opacity protein-like surface antigen